MVKKKPQYSHFMTVELQNILAGGILIVFGSLMFLSTKETSIAGKYFSLLGTNLFSLEYYRWIFSPITILLGIMILVKKASWSATRFAGLILYFIATTSFVGLYRTDTIGFFDLHDSMVTFLGKSAAVLTLLVLFFASLYMTLRISYRSILSKVREVVPSFSSVREVVLPSGEEEYDEPKKK